MQPQLYSFKFKLAKWEREVKEQKQKKEIHQQIRKWISEHLRTAILDRIQSMKNCYEINNYLPNCISEERHRDIIRELIDKTPEIHSYGWQIGKISKIKWRKKKCQSSMTRLETSI